MYNKFSSLSLYDLVYRRERITKTLIIFYFCATGKNLFSHLYDCFRLKRS
jgi:hypothetical protein